MTPSELAAAESSADAKVSSSTTVTGSHDGVLRGFDAQIAPEGQLVLTRRRRNALAPVAKIPPEVMCTIFTAARDQWSSETGRMKWTALTHVCHSWRQIALSHPPLWAVVWTSIGDHWLKETLERSNNAPSTLVVDGEDDHRLTAARMSVLCGVMANTRRLDQVGIQAHADKLQKLVLSLHHSANNLRHLFLRHLTDAIPVILPQSFYHRTAPRLERLILKGVSSTWDSAPFSRITILDIEGSDNSAFELVAASVFFDALRSISRLQRLAVTLPFLQPITDSTELPVIRLEGLKHFKLYGSCPTSANPLKHLHLPACATLDLLDEEADKTSASALVHLLKSS
ncbi:hypothetical protein BKA70DRAFT_1557036 [Coprinopsis sp. MPI-PUGE-AT-0042]|nr:hypothetical protein BKA70DRAFT_1557036 [Coprinopsis sp. MPI-PUGE-AT-0042]